MSFSTRDIYENPNKTFSKNTPLFQKITQSTEFQNKIKVPAKWKPRRMLVSKGVEKTGLPQVYQEGSPEQTLGEFLFSWIKKDYLRMAEILMPYTKEKSFSKFTKKIISDFEKVDLKNFQFVEVLDETPSQTKITVLINSSIGGKKQKQNIEVKLEFLDEKGTPSVFGVEEGRWTFDKIEFHLLIFN
ncbi:MAG: hypothetical protein IH995_09265 [Proteobacteria bacterium]|nr:hypothetical protein [Pseudomonadota bacterium]